MKPNTNNYKNKSQRQIDRNFGATKPLVLPTTSGTSDVNFTNNPKDSTSDTTSMPTPAPVPSSVTTDANFTSNPNATEHEQASAITTNQKPAQLAVPAAASTTQQPQQPRLSVKLDATALLCQLATHQYMLAEHGSFSSNSNPVTTSSVPTIPAGLLSPSSRELVQRFFKPLFDTGYAYALWLANSKPGLISLPRASATQQPLAVELAKNSMLAVWRRVTYGTASSPVQSQHQPHGQAQPENLEVITDVPGLITHCFYQEYANFLESRLHHCQRQAHQPTDNWSSSYYCNHPDCSPALALALAAASTPIATPAHAKAKEAPASTVSNTSSDNFAFALDIYQVARLIVPTPLIDRLDSYLKLATPARRATLRLRMQVAFTRLTTPQRQAVTDRALGYPLHQIAARRDWTIRQTERHLQKGKELLRFELAFPGFAPQPLPGRPSPIASRSFRQQPEQVA